MASGRVERIKEMRNQIPGHRLRYYADAVDAGLSIEDVKAGRVETWMGVAKADLLRERDEARAERDDAKEWVHHATRMANERDEARADRDALALALKAIKAYTIDPRAHERASKALATLDAGGRNRPPVDGQGGMTIDKGVGGEDD